MKNITYQLRKLKKELGDYKVDGCLLAYFCDTCSILVLNR